MNSARLFSPFALTVALLCNPAAAQGLIFDLTGTAPDDAFGTAVAGVGDANLDGWPDVLVGAPSGDSVATNAGYAVLFSGRDGTVLRRFDGDSADQNVGRTAGAAGDVDRDGYPDLLIGRDGAVDVIAGRTFHVIRTVSSPFDHHACAGDVDADGHDDLIVTVAANTVAVISGSTGAQLHLFQTVLGDLFGSAVAGAGDVDRDGHDDVLVGAPGIVGSPSGNERGFARVFSGRTGALLYERLGTAFNDRLGSAVGGAGDVNRDGFADFIVGASQEGVFPPHADSGGYAVVYSGRDGSQLARQNGVCVALGFCVFRILVGTDGVGPAGDLDGDGYADYFVGNSLFSGKEHSWLRIPIEGKPLAAARDVNRDGVDDVIVGDSDANRAIVLSGLDRRVVRTTLWSSLGDEIVAVTGIGDVDDDDRPDYAVGFSGNLLNQTGIFTPVVRVYSGATGAELHRIAKPSSGYRPPISIALSAAGDIDGDGTPDLVVGWQSQRGLLRDVDVYSGADFTALHSLVGDPGAGEFGSDVDGCVDWNGDQRDDFALSSSNGGANGSGFVEIRSGVDHAILDSFAGDDAGDRFGASFALVADLDGDSVPDLVAGAPGDDDNGDGCGSVRVLSGATGTVLYTLYGDNAREGYGTSVANAGDVDSDGASDFLVGAPGWGGGLGLAELVSGATGRTLSVLRGTTTGEQLGARVSGGTDVDRDGVPDFLVGTPRRDTVALYSGADGTRLETYDLPSSGFHFAIAGDFTGNGYGEILSASTAPYQGRFLPDYVNVYGLADTGSYNTFGAGCRGGVGAPDLTWSGGTAIGDAVTLSIDKVLPSSMGVLHFGFSDERLGLLGLPVPLDFIGMTGCVQYTSMDVRFPLTTNGSMEITFRFTIPADPAINGARVFQQYTHVDLAANPLGLVNSNAARLVVGPRPR